MLLELCLVALSLLVFLYFYLRRNDNYWKKYGIAYEKPSFFFGNFRDGLLGIKHIGYMYKDLYEKFSTSPFVGVFVMRTPTLMVRDLDVVKSVLVGNFASFTDTEFGVDKDEDPIWASNPIPNKGEEWRKVRAKWVQHLSPAKMKISFDSIIKSGKALVDYVTQEVAKNPNKKFNCLDLSSAFYLDYVISGIFGLENNTFGNPKNDFKQVKNSILAHSFKEDMVALLVLLVPWFGRFVPNRFVKKDAEQIVMKISREIIRLRKETGLPNADIYDTLQKCSELEGKKTFDELDLAGKLFGMILDGSETASDLLNFGMYELACQPEVQVKLREELDEATKTNGGVISFDDTSNLPYLDMVASEILRLYAPLTHLGRTCTKDIVLESHGEKVEIKTGMNVIIPTYAFHTDPQYFPEPYEFKPERFSKEAKDYIPKYCYLPFGEGPRTCAGMRLGLMEAKVLLATLVSNFDMKPGLTLSRPIKFDPKSFINRPEVDLTIILAKRKK